MAQDIVRVYEAPEYQGIEPILVPCDGKRYKFEEWPHVHHSIMAYGGSNGGVSFCVPSIDPEITDDLATMGKYVRFKYFDLRGSGLRYVVRKYSYSEIERLTRWGSRDNLKELLEWPKI